MLIANIDLNKPTEPERHIERLVSATNVTQMYQSEEFPDLRRPVHKRRGVILRKGDKRRRERRHESGESSQPERKRRSLNRRGSKRWNPETHEIMLIALERNPASEQDWNVGDEIIVDQGPHKEPVYGHRVSKPAGPGPASRSSFSPPVQPDLDYVVHLSSRK